MMRNFLDVIEQKLEKDSMLSFCLFFHPMNGSFYLFVPEQNLGSRRDPPQINRLPKWSLSGKKIGRHIPKGPELLTFHFSHVLNKAKSILLRKNLPEN